MASALIHIAVANELNKELKKNKTKLLIGSIAPDISKQMGESKDKSHFLNGKDDIPNLEWFLIRYKDKLNDDFVLGYYIHLFTDYLWFKYFIPEIYKKDMITKLDGTTFKCSKNGLKRYIYNDYTNLNIQIIDEYNLDLKLFYNKLPEIDNIIQEISIDKLDVLLDKLGLIIENSKEKKQLIFNIENIKKFIGLAVELTLSNLNDIQNYNKKSD